MRGVHVRSNHLKVTSLPPTSRFTNSRGENRCLSIKLALTRPSQFNILEIQAPGKLCTRWTKPLATMALYYYWPRAAEHTMLHATIASFEYRARRQTVSRGCRTASSLRNCYSKGKTGGWTDGERGGVKILEKKIACSRNIRLESSAVLCSCCTRHTRLTGSEECETGRGWVVQR